MRKLICGFVVLIGLLPGCAMQKPLPPVEPPAPPREFRAAWVATVANIDWPTKPGLSTEKQIDEMNAILNRAVELKFNAIILQVRPSCDALYDSDLEPWSEYLTGEQGRSPEPYYDPLGVWVRSAHQRGLELHVWFNPYRARHTGAKSPNAPEHISNTHPEVVRKFNGWEWLDPSEKAASQHTLAVILDVVKRYDIDGVHLDDYFYPYASYLNKKDFPDDAQWEKYQKANGKMSRGDWRRDHVNQLIKLIYEGIKKEKAHVKFGISPFGIWQPNHPAGIKGMNQYEELYADAKLWLNMGWCDYWTPQLYWAIESDQSYPKLLEWWVEQNTMKRHIWPGNSISRVGDGEKGWPRTEIINQIGATRAQDGATGNVFFSMKGFMQNRGGLNDALKEGPYASGALVPASTWLDSVPPEKPVIHADVESGGGVRVSWLPALGQDDVTTWGVWARAGGEWKFSTYPAAVRQVRIVPENDAKITHVAVIAADRNGNSSAPVTLPLYAPKKKWWQW